MPLKTFFYSLLLLYFAVLCSCASTSQSKRYYSNQYTKKLLKHNGAKKLLRGYEKHLVKTYFLHDKQPFKKHNYWIPDHPVSFEEYMQFMDYCRDSIARMLVGYIYNWKGTIYLDWSKELAWNDKNFVDKLDVITTPYDLRASKGQSIYYSRLDYIGDSSFSPESTWILPDTSGCCRINSNTAMIFDENAKSYPINGITYQQAKAYCNWLMITWNNTLSRKNRRQRFLVNLPEQKDSNLIKSMYAEYRAAKLTAQSCGYENPEFFLIGNKEKIPATTCNYLLWIKISLIDNK